MTNANKTIFKILKLLVVVAVVAVGGWFVSINMKNNKQSTMSDITCNQIEDAIRNNAMRSGEHGDVEKLKELNNIFTENCKNRKTEVKKVAKPITEKNVEPLPDSTCAAVETLLLERIKSFPERDMDWQNRFDKASIYAELTQRGCPENKEKFKELAIRELEIGTALNHGDGDDYRNKSIYDKIGVTPKEEVAVF